MNELEEKEVMFAASELKQLINSVASITVAAPVREANGKMTIRWMDDSQIAMIDATLEGTTAERFYGYNFEDALKVLSDAEGTVGVKLGVETAAKRVFFNWRQFTASLPIVEPEEDKIPKPIELDFSVKGRLCAGDLYRSLKHTNRMNSHTTFVLSSTGLEVSAIDDKGKIKSVLPCEIVSEHPVEVQAMFANEFLLAFLKTLPAKTDIDLSMKDDKPMKIEWRYGGLSIKYFLAPRVENA